MTVCALVGGQFGSEGKGLIAGEIANDYPVHVRVGAANAGHTLYTVSNETADKVEARRVYHKHVMQQLPCATYGNPHAKLVVGPGALISPEIFITELETAREFYQRPVEVFVDRRAHVIHASQIEREAASDLVARIGSTSATAREGIGEAQVDRVRRRGIPVSEYDWTQHARLADDREPVGFVVADTVDHLHQAILFDTPILLEGTQGAGLSLTTGLYPYVTSRNTTAAGLAADCGIGPTQVDRVILVCRTYPIRVAGNSGPFFEGSEEIDWRDIGVDADTERTTVTKKIRRVATFSYDQIKQAALLNGATEIALTFADYIEPSIAGMRNGSPADHKSFQGHGAFRGFPRLESLIRGLEAQTDVPVTMIGTGPHSVLHRKSPLLETRQ